MQDLAESRRGSIIEHPLESEADSDEEKDEVILQPKFLKMGVVLIDEPETENKTETKSAERRESNSDDHKEIGLLQEQLTAINVQFKEMQIQNMEKDNQLLSLEKSLQEKINEISRINSKNEILAKCREELLEQSKEVNGLEQRVLELEEEIRVLTAPKVKPVNPSLYITFD